METRAKESINAKIDNYSHLLNTCYVILRRKKIEEFSKFRSKKVTIGTSFFLSNFWYINRQIKVCVRELKNIDI